MLLLLLLLLLLRPHVTHRLAFVTSHDRLIELVWQPGIRVGLGLCMRLNHRRLQVMLWLRVLLRLSRVQVRMLLLLMLMLR